MIRKNNKNGDEEGEGEAFGGRKSIDKKRGRGKGNRRDQARGTALVEWIEGEHGKLWSISRHLWGDSQIGKCKQEYKRREKSWEYGARKAGSGCGIGGNIGEGGKETKKYSRERGIDRRLGRKKGSVKKGQ